MLLALNDRIGELFGSFNLKFLQSSSHFGWIDGWRHICEIIVVFPSSSFYYLECHLFGETVPVVHIRTSVDAPDGEVGADLDAF